jgi:hypothetical protein
VQIGTLATWRKVLRVGVAGTLIAATLLCLQFVRLARNDLGSDATAPFMVGTSWRIDESLAQRQIDVHLTPGTTTASGFSARPMTRYCSTDSTSPSTCRVTGLAAR